ncbi:MAG: pyruvate formate-lyase-activating protein [Oscillospiraceae bacterium]
MIGKIHSFQSLGTVDGPGIRTVLFMQGCTLRCPYCHNPDTWKLDCGENVSVDEMISKILRFKSYFGKDGGVTVSGGEPLIQAEFVTELFKKLHQNGINTALDTAGAIINKNTENLLNVTDLVLLDIKYSDDDKYKKYIGIPIKLPLEFLSMCEKKNISVIIRQVITEGINDSEEDIKALKNLLSPYKNIKKIELLPFRKLCISKYEEMGVPFPFSDKNETNMSKIESLSQLLK